MLRADLGFWDKKVTARLREQGTGDVDRERRPRPLAVMRRQGLPTAARASAPAAPPVRMAMVRSLGWLMSGPARDRHLLDAGAR